MERIITHKDGSQQWMSDDEFAEYENDSKKSEIESCKAELAATDYKCMKHADGELTDEEYEPIRQHRHELRARINELEAQL